MKSKISVLLIVGFLLCFTFGCQQGEEVAEEAIPDELIPADLTDAHNSWWDGLLNEDTTVINKLLSNDVAMGFGDNSWRRIFVGKACNCFWE